jgi:MFS family permease
MDIQRQLHFSNTVYGTGAGIFFLGYALCDLPSTLLLRRVGTRLWIARIMISWGFISASMVFMATPHSFYLLRLLLGVAEAGFVPGMLLYLTFWFPSHERARAVALFMTATSLAGVVGAPLASALLKLDGFHGLSGWQWLFLMEGVPTVLLGISVLFILKDSPDKVSWLSPEEKRWLKGELAQDQARYGATEQHRLLDAFRMPAVWLLAGVYIIIQIGVYIVNLWMPLILSSLSQQGAAVASASLIARYATLPYLLAAIFTVVIGRTSDRTNERRWHIAGCMTLAAAGFVWASSRSTARTVSIRSAPIARCPPSCSSRFDPRPAAGCAQSPRPDSSESPPRQSDSSRTPSHSTSPASAPAPAQSAAPYGRRAPNGGRKNFTAAPVMSSSTALAIRQLLPHPRRRLGRQPRMAHGVVAQQMPRRDHPAHNLRPLARKSPSRKMSRAQPCRASTSSSAAWPHRSAHRRRSAQPRPHRARNQRPPEDLRRRPQRRIHQPARRQAKRRRARRNLRNHSRHVIFPAARRLHQCFSSANTSSACPAGVTLGTHAAAAAPSPCPPDQVRRPLHPRHRLAVHRLLFSRS